jgi:hypothetical protein
MESSELVGRLKTTSRSLFIQWGARFVLSFLALARLWLCRYCMNSDGVSYLDMGDFYWKGNWHAALNSLWSPLYGWLTGFILLLTKPGIRWEYPEVHLLNLAIFICALAAFEFFWRELLAANWPLAPPAAWLIGYLLFAQTHLITHPVNLETPDLLVAALVYFVSGMIFRFLRAPLRGSAAFFWGVVMGVGYLAKAAMLPFAFVVLLVMAVVASKERRGKWLVLSTLAGVLVISLPFAAALSWNLHRAAFSDAGWLNYGVHVNHARDRAAQTTGREISTNPAIHEFASPVDGTYPILYNPAYWNADIDTSLHPRLQVQAILQNLWLIVCHVFVRSGLLLTIAAMFFLGARARPSWRSLIAAWPVLIPSLAAFLLYVLVHWESRYTSGEMAVLWGAALTSMHFARPEQRVRAFWSISLLMGIIFAFSFAISTVKSARSLRQLEQPILVAERLHAMGLRPGDQVALIGCGYEGYWARLDRVKIVAEMRQYLSQEAVSSVSFWSLDAQAQGKVLQTMRETGANAVIAKPAQSLLPPGWSLVGRTGYAVYFFHP